jgi:positive phototaxis protein PixI
MMSDSSLTTDISTSLEVSSSGSTKGEKYLKFQLVTDITALLPISQLAEVLTIDVSQITPIPQLPSWVMGAYNWRGEALWMVDLAYLIGFLPWYQQSSLVTTYTAVILRLCDRSLPGKNTSSQIVGLVINRAEAIEWCEPQLLQPPEFETETPHLIPFLRGYQVKSDGEQLAVLDEEVILATISKI